MVNSLLGSVCVRAGYLKTLGWCTRPQVVRPVSSYRHWAGVRELREGVPRSPQDPGLLDSFLGYMGARAGVLKTLG